MGGVVGFFFRERHIFLNPEVILRKLTKNSQMPDFNHYKNLKICCKKQNHLIADPCQ